MSIVSNFEPVKVNSNIVNFNTDPFKELDIFPAPPFNDDETIRKRNKSLLNKFLELATDTSSSDKKEVEFKIPSRSSDTTTHESETSSKSYNDDISFEELVKQENLPIEITSGYRNTLTAQGKPSNHSKRDSKGNPMAYDIKPKSGYTFEDLRKILYNNPRVVSWFKKRGWGVLEEMQDGKSRGFYDIRGKFHYTKASGPHFHIGPDHYGVEWYGSKVNKNLYYAQEGIKLPQINFISKFDVPEFKKPEIRYFNPEDVNPFTQSNSSNYNQELLEGLYNLAQEKKASADNPLTNSPFYLGNSLPTSRRSESQSSSEQSYQAPTYKQYTGNDAKLLSDAITEYAKTNPDVEKYRDLLMFTADRESKFNPKAQTPYGTAYGFFGITKSTREQLIPGISKEQFGNNLQAQVEAAYKLMKTYLNGEDYKKLRERGLNDKQIATLGWLGIKYYKDYARTGYASFNSEKIKSQNGHRDVQDFLNEYK